MTFPYASRLICLGVLVALGGCSAANTPTGLTSPETTGATSTQPLSENEIVTTLSGKTFAWVRARDQASGRTTFSVDGAMSWARADVSANGVGKWWVEKGRLCQRYDPTPTWKGGMVCRTLTVKGSDLVTSPNDGGLVTFTVVAGS